METINTAEISVAPWARRSGMLGALQVASTAVLTSSTTGGSLDILPYRSGGFGDRTTLGDAARDASSTEEVAWLGRLEVRTPFALLDAPVRSTHLSSLSGAYYVEQGGTFGAVTASTVVGGELVAGIGFNAALKIDLTGGFAFRLPHPDSTTTTDWKVYVMLGTPVPPRAGLQRVQRH